MREYEFTIVFDMEVTESEGAEASVEAMTAHIEARDGKVLSVDHWGRRRMAYPINGALDGDYIVSRIELPPTGIQPLNDALRIDERVYRHLLVRADELPPPPPPREPRRRPDSEEATVSQTQPPPASPATEPSATTAAPVAPTVPAADAGATADPPAAAQAQAPREESAAPPADGANTGDEVSTTPDTVDPEAPPSEQGS